MTSCSLDASTSSNDQFITWFKSRGGSIHSAVGLTTFSMMGRGAAALQDIKEGTILFTLPRSLTLSIRTSCLPSMFGRQAWKKYGMHKGWTGLILCMLWEAAAGSDGKWSGYLASLPDTFQTPMFWSELELQELEGSPILDKIGKAEAENDYYEKLLPAVKSRPDLFPQKYVDSYYSLHKYHIMGSLILSRSFHVEARSGETDDNDDEHSTNHADNRDAMEVDTAQPEADNKITGDCPNLDKDEESGSEDENHVDPADVAMVPMADMLNARYNSENAKLCYESEDLQMISTRDISTGEQIWNTYGDLPNSDLLRRYGHVDMVPMPDGGEGNPADIAEIRADLVVDILREQTTKNISDSISERIEWWLEEGGDDIFTLETEFALPKELISLIRLLTVPTADWEKTREKRKIPRSKADSYILKIVYRVLEKRLEAYRTSIEEDQAILSAMQEISINYRNATIVRIGEKRILEGALTAVRKMLGGEKDSKGSTGSKRKDRRNSDSPGSCKKAKS